MAPDFSPAQERFTTFEDHTSSNNSAVDASNPVTNLVNYFRGPQSTGGISRTVSFNEETARQEAKNTYDGLIYEMNEVAKEATGETVSMPGFNLAAFYDLKGQTGVGDLGTPWSGGVYDHFEPPRNNSGQIQTDQLKNLLLNVKPGEMVVKYGTSNELAGILETVEWDAGAEGDLNTLYTHLHASQDAEGKKDSRPLFTIRYNPNGPVRHPEDADAERYSVYEVMLDPTYAKTYGQESEGDPGDRSTKFQDNDHTLSIYIPKGKYPNSADHGSAKHMWQRMLNAGENGSSPIVSHPSAGNIEISMVGDAYYATINHRTYDIETHTWRDENTLVQELTNINDYDQFENLKRDLDTILR